MPSTSKAQQRLMGQAYAYKKGELKSSEVSAEIKELADSMTLKQLKDFASTKHDGLPERVPENLAPGSLNGMGPVTLPAGETLGSGDVPAGSGDAEEEYKKKKRKPGVDIMTFERFTKTNMKHIKLFEAFVNEISMSSWGELEYTMDDVNQTWGWYGALEDELGASKAEFLTHQSISEICKMLKLSQWEALALLNSKAGRHAGEAFINGERFKSGVPVSDALSAFVWYYGNKAKVTKAAKQAGKDQFPDKV